MINSVLRRKSKDFLFLCYNTMCEEGGDSFETNH